MVPTVAFGTLDPGAVEVEEVEPVGEEDPPAEAAGRGFVTNFSAPGHVDSVTLAVFNTGVQRRLSQEMFLPEVLPDKASKVTLP